MQYVVCVYRQMEQRDIYVASSATSSAKVRQCVSVSVYSVCVCVGVQCVCVRACVRARRARACKIDVH